MPRPWPNWTGGSESHWLSLTEAAGIPDSHVYTCIEDPCADGSTAFLDDVNNGAIQMQGWSPSGNEPWTYALPVSEYGHAPNKLTTDPAKMQSYTVEMDYERADHIGDSGTVAFLTQVSQLLQNTSSLGPNELPHTYQLSVRGDELISVGAKGYKNTNSWQSGLDSVSIPQIMALPGFNITQSCCGPETGITTSRRPGSRVWPWRTEAPCPSNARRL